MGTTVVYDGFHVDFPYDLYEPQRQYITKLLECLVNGKHGLLESPTGTGKTLSLLCGALAWQRAIVEGKTPHPAHLTHARDTCPYPAATGSKKGCGAPPANSGPNPWTDLEHLGANGGLRSSRCAMPTSGQRDAGTAKPRKCLSVNEPSAFTPSQPTMTGKGVDSQRSHRRLVEPTMTSEVTALPPPKIFFASRYLGVSTPSRRQRRTHAQLRQVVKELRKTPYVSSRTTGAFEDYFEDAGPPPDTTVRPDPSGSRTLKVTVLGSRDLLCVSQDLQKLRGSARTAGCHAKLKVHSCRYEGGLSRFKTEWLEEPRDIEAFRRFGLSMGFCPYYAAKDHHAEANLILLPYEYLLSTSMRQQLKFNLRHSVIIFDEGHNVEKVAEDAGSFDLSLSQIRLAVDVLRDFSHQEKHPGDESALLKIQDLLIEPLEALIHFIETAVLNDEAMLVLPGTDMVTAFERCGFKAEHQDAYATILGKCLDGCRALSAVSESAMTEAFRSSNEDIDIALKAKVLEDVQTALTVAYSPAVVGQLAWHRFLVREHQHEAHHEKKAKRMSLSTFVSDSDRVLSLWCFSAGAVLSDFATREQIHSLIVTSGTLGPIDRTEEILGGYGLLPFDVKFENTHVVPPENVYVEILPAYNDTPFCFTMKNRDDSQMFRALGQTIVDVAAAVPGGVIVFFSSFRQLSDAKEWWARTGIERLLSESRVVVYEERGHSQADFDTVLESLKTAVLNAQRQSVGHHKRRSGLLFAVARGRSSEGMNFPDDFCRCVIMVGIPYPSLVDTRVRLKRQVLQQAFGQQRDSQWYSQQASQAVNQAVGRVVRHIHDFGCILLIDSRYAEPRQFQDLSFWVRSVASLRPKAYPDVLRGLKAFFQRFSTVESRCVDTSEALGVPQSDASKEQNRHGVDGIPTWFRLRAHTTGTTGNAVTPRRPLRATLPREEKKTSTEHGVLKRSRQAVLTTLCQKKRVPPHHKLTPSTSLSQDIKQASSVANALRSAMPSVASRSTEKSSVPSTADTTVSSSATCSICWTSQNKEHMQRSRRCGHSACHACWTRTLKQSLVCPFCHVKMRLEHLSTET